MGTTSIRSLQHTGIKVACSRSTYVLQTQALRHFHPFSPMWVLLPRRSYPNPLATVAETYECLPDVALCTYAAVAACIADPAGACAVCAQAEAAAGAGNAVGRGRAGCQPKCAVPRAACQSQVPVSKMSRLLTAHEFIAWLLKWLMP